MIQSVSSSQEGAVMGDLVQVMEGGTSYGHSAADREDGEVFPSIWKFETYLIKVAIK